MENERLSAKTASFLFLFADLRVSVKRLKHLKHVKQPKHRETAETP